MKKYSLIMNYEECNEYFVNENRVIEYAKNRLIANPDDINDLGFDSDKIGIEQATYIIEFYNEEVKEVSVTKDNIHLYYEFMSDGDLENYAKPILNNLLGYRNEKVVEALKDFLPSKWYENVITSHLHTGSGATSCSYSYKIVLFGVEDTLKPIDEYIVDIKGSEEYKQYIYSSIDDYQNRLMDKQKEIVVSHCIEHSIEPIICAWYNDKNDFNSDWVEELNYSQEDADSLLAGNSGNKEEFITFDDGQIIRFSI